MREPPPDLLAGLSESDVARTRRWWESIGEVEREEFVLLWDARTDSTALICVRDEAGAAKWEELPIELRGSLADDEDAREHKMWREELRDYYQGRYTHDGIVVRARTFHIGALAERGVELIERAHYDPDDGTR